MTTLRSRKRRAVVGMLAAAGLAGWSLPFAARAKAAGILTKAIPSSGEAIPVIGLGSSRTFNVGDDPELRDQCADVMAHFLGSGGTLIDSSPMYGSSQPVIGFGLRKLAKADAVFSADKVWTSDTGQGAGQIEASRQYWMVPRFDLLQVHNLVAWETHLPALHAMQARGDLRYVGITTSHGRRHGEFERIMRGHKLDFVQLTYNIVDREVEQRLLPLARERGIAVIVNRPFRRGDLLSRLSRHPLPSWAAAEVGVNSWPQFLLKYIVSHPAVTCAIPATTRVEHVVENMQAGTGALPDAALREKMAAYVAGL